MQYIRMAMNAKYPPIDEYHISLSFYLKTLIIMELSAFLYDTPCEHIVIGTLIKYNWSYPQEAARLQEDLFGDPMCKYCMKVLAQLNEQRKQFTDLEIIWKLQEQNPDVSLPDLMSLTANALSSPEQFTTHVCHLNELHTRRRIALLANALWERANDAGKDLDETLGFLHDETQRILESGLPEGSSTLTDALGELQTLVNNRQDGIVRDPGTMVGFPEIDDDGGFMPGQLIIFAGATAHGKSALALSVVKKILTQELPVAYFSLEMTHLELASRMLSMESGVSSSKQMHPSRPLEEHEFVQVAQAFGALSGVSQYLHFDDKFTANIDQICSSIRALHYHHQLRGVFIDYLQILNATQQVNNREQFMGEVARRLKNLAVELGIWIVTLSQFNRNDLGDEPTLNRLRDSGQIAEAADRVLLIHRPEATGHGAYACPYQDVTTHRTALLNLAKNRNGRTVRFIVDFIPERTLFAHHEGALPFISKMPSSSKSIGGLRQMTATD